MSTQKTSTTRVRHAATPLGLLLFLAGCAGGGGSNRPAVISAAGIPTQLLITTPGTLPAGTFGQFYQTTLKASGGTPPYQWFPVDSDPLVSGLTLSQSTGELSGVLTSGPFFSAGVVDAKKNSFIANFQIPLNFGPDKVLTSILPPATLHHAYDVNIQCNPGPNCNNARLDSSSALPPGLNLDPNGRIFGSPTALGTFTFTVVIDFAPNAAQQTYNLAVSDKQPRNESLSTAIGISNGLWSASISPYHDSSSNGPDEDFYALTAPGGSYVSINIFAERRNNSPLDSVLEIVDQNGQRFHTCSDAGISTAFTNPCMNDDIIPEFTLDSMLTFKVPGTGSQKFFVHVLDWRGDARPDMLYQMAIFGAD